MKRTGCTKLALALLFIAGGIANQLLPAQACANDWTYSLTPEFFSDVCFNSDNSFWAVGYNGQIWSRNAGSDIWEKADPIWGITNQYFKAIAADADGSQLMVAVGYSGTIISSIDLGRTWDIEASPTTSNLRSVACADLSSGKGWVIVGDNGTILHSSYLSWSQVSSGVTERLYDVCYGNGLFVVTGLNGRILTSPDGINWTIRNSGTSRYLYSVTYGNGKFVAVGQLGIVLTSSNGINWTVRSSSTTNHLYSVTYAPDINLFTAAGYMGQIVTSPDGINWTPDAVEMQTEVFGIAYGAGEFAGAGDGVFIRRCMQ